MIFHGVGIDAERFAHLGVGETLDRELQDVALAVAEDQRGQFVPTASGKGIDVAVAVGSVCDEDVACRLCGRQGDDAQ